MVENHTEFKYKHIDRCTYEKNYNYKGWTGWSRDDSIDEEPLKVLNSEGHY